MNRKASVTFPGVGSSSFEKQLYLFQFASMNCYMERRVFVFISFVEIIRRVIRDFLALLLLLLLRDSIAACIESDWIDGQSGTIASFRLLRGRHVDVFPW
jgi:hypothetical protein